MPFSLKFFYSICFLPAVLFSQDEALVDEEVWLDSLLGIESETIPSGGDLPDDPSLSEMRDVLATIQAMTGWSTDGEIVMGAGWRENVLLEEVSGIDSGFAQVEADFFALRPGVGNRAELLALLYGEYRYFFDVPGLDLESMTMAQVGAKWSFGERWETGTFFEGTFSEQAFDATLNDFETDASSVRVWQPDLGIDLGYDLGRFGQLEWRSQIGLTRYNEEDEDYETVAGSMFWSGDIAVRNRIRLGVETYQENYDDRLERVSIGFLQDAPLLELTGVRWQASWSYELEEGVVRGLKTRVSHERESDAVGDYYDRDRLQVRQSIELLWRNWEMDLSLSFGSTDYDSRLNAAFSEETRGDESWRWSFEAKRPLSSRLVFLARFEDSDKESNAAGLSYDGTSVFIGLSLAGAGGS
ncbi:hypothetical protein VDG1235_1457 [Verrucomicrobiia bacterium DG1235]|nr:hypothetical protein VDG1235_1457 [Verrucomicrobiae bacterium DG1235]